MFLARTLLRNLKA